MKVFISPCKLACFAVSVVSLDASLSRRIANVLKESLRRNLSLSLVLSLPLFLFLLFLSPNLSSHLSLPPRLFLESRCEEGDYFWKASGPRKSRANARHTHTCVHWIHFNPDARYTSFATIDMLACHTQHTFTRMRTRVVAFTGISSLLSKALTKVGQGQPTFCALL